MNKIFTRTEKTRIVAAVIAAVVALLLGLSALFGAGSQTILPGPDQYNEASNEDIRAERLIPNRVENFTEGILPAGSPLYAVHSAYAVRLGENGEGGTAMVRKSHWGLTKEECELNAHCSLSNEYTVTKSNLQIDEPFDYDAYTYTAFWYRWYQTESGAWTTEPLYQEGLSYLSCVASKYCNPDLSQGRKPIED